MADNYCHASGTSLCGIVIDAPGTPDGQVVDGRPGTADSPPGTPDGRISDAPPGTPDAPVVPDAPTIPDAPQSPPDAPCKPLLEDVETEGSPEFSDVNLDSGGTLHVSYVRAATSELWYARKVPGGTWQHAMVDDATTFKKDQFVDASGGVHIVYTQESATTNLILRYAHLPPGSDHWSNETVTSDGQPIDGTIAVDPSGTIDIAYYDRFAGTLNLATRGSSQTDWTVDPIDTDGDVGEFPSLGLVPANSRIAVSYRDVSNKTLKLANRIGGTWLIRTVDNTADVGSYTSIAIDKGGNEHIAYSNNTAGSLRYMLVDAGGGMPVRLLADMGQTGRWNSIGVDPLGGVHISTQAFGANELHVAYRAGSGTFSATPIDSASGKVGRFTSIAVDSLGGAHVTYNDDSHATIRHAFLCPPGQ